MIWVYVYGSVIIVSLLSVLAFFPFLSKKLNTKPILLTLLSLSAGTLLGAVFLHLLPEAIAKNGYTLELGLYVLVGFISFFIIERLIHWHHHHKHGEEGHSHGYTLAPLNIIGDGLHNFIDGLIIGATYLVSIPLGIATTISVIFHEIPQEIADMGVLLYSGMKKKTALFFNFLSAVMAILGATIALLFGGAYISFILPFAAGTFLYIAASSLVPELHHKCSVRSDILHVGVMILGILLMLLLA